MLPCDVCTSRINSGMAVSRLRCSETAISDCCLCEPLLIHSVFQLDFGLSIPRLAISLSVAEATRCSSSKEELRRNGAAGAGTAFFLYAAAPRLNERMNTAIRVVFMKNSFGQCHKHSCMLKELCDYECSGPEEAVSIQQSAFSPRDVLRTECPLIRTEKQIN